DGIRDFHVTGVQTCALPISEGLGEAGGGHRGGGADLALAADLGTGDGGVLLEQDADRGGGEQEPDHALVPGAAAEVQVVVEHGGDDAGRAVGRGGHDPAAGRVLLVDGERVQRDPVAAVHRVAGVRGGRGEQAAVVAGAA